jgi:hypothetical protein
MSHLQLRAVITFFLWVSRVAAAIPGSLSDGDGQRRLRPGAGRRGQLRAVAIVALAIRCRYPWRGGPGRPTLLCLTRDTQHVTAADGFYLKTFQLSYTVCIVVRPLESYTAMLYLPVLVHAQYSVFSVLLRNSYIAWLAVRYN